MSVVRTLLTECTLDAEAVNLKGRNPLHELARCAKDNAATICDLFLECMSQYPIDNTGAEKRQRYNYFERLIERFPKDIAISLFQLNCTLYVFTTVLVFQTWMETRRC